MPGGGGTMVSQISTAATALIESLIQTRGDEVFLCSTTGRGQISISRFPEVRAQLLASPNFSCASLGL